MPLITWSDKYSVNVKSIDVQHQKLVNIINNLHDALSSGKAKETLAKTLNELIDYTKKHFAYEETLLKSNGYMAFITHKSTHDNFVKKISQMHFDYNSGKTNMSIELMNFLKDWLVNHINKTDKEYSQHLKSKGVN